jgi:hypothetical protein
MRKGHNPNKDLKRQTIDFTHQVVIPVYIPHHNDYFEDALKILEVSLNSMIRTVHDKSFISVVSNGSSKQTESYLYGLYEKGLIHELIITENTGKLNSIFKAIAGHDIPLVTISDADVFFLPSWQEETYKVFINFPKAGTVGLIPQFLSYQSHSENILFDFLFSKNLKFGNVEDPDGLKHFYKSLGWKDNYPKSRLKYTLFLKRNNFKSIVGSGHVVATYRRDLFNNIQFHNPYKMGGDSEKILDELAGKYGLYRFTTSANKAFHLGNKLDENEFDTINPTYKPSSRKNQFPLLQPVSFEKNTFVNRAKRIFIQTILKSHKIRMLYLKRLGLPKGARKSF